MSVFILAALFSWCGGGCASTRDLDAYYDEAGNEYLTWQASPEDPGLPKVVPTPPSAPTPLVEVEPIDDATRQFLDANPGMLELRDSDYQVGAGDLLEISIFEWELSEETRTLECRVSKSGAVVLPVVGTVHIDGLSIEQIQEQVKSSLSSTGLIQNPRVAVTIKEYRNRMISVLGAVNAPGVYALLENATTLLDILSLAGGPAVNAAGHAHVLRRKETGNDRIQVEIDLDALMRTGREDLNVVLKKDDVVFVPESETAFVYGEVRQPGPVRLSQAATVLEAIALAGGVESSANKSAVRLMRMDQNERGVSEVLDLGKLESGSATDPDLLAGDVIMVSESGGRKFVLGLWEVFRNIFTVTYRVNAND